MKPLLAALRRIPPSWGSALAAALFVIFVALFNQYRTIFEIDPDESNNLIKALLLEHGASFGDELWSDQPPLFTYLLAALFRVVGFDVDAARTLVLVFSGLLVFAVVDSARLLGGARHGLAAALLLVGSSSYVPLSVSVMIGLPSIALATLSAWALLRAQLRPRLQGEGMTWPELGWLLACGALFGASLGTKLFTAFLVGPLLAGFWLAELARGAASRRTAASPEPERAPGVELTETPGVDLTKAEAARSARRAPRRLGELWRRWALWLPNRLTLRRLFVGTTSFTAGLVGLLALALFPFLRAGTFGGLVETHQELRESRASLLGSLDTVLRFVQEDPVLYGFAGLGAIFALLRRRHGVHLFSAWLLLGGMVLAGHYPVWPHHRILLSVPAAVLAGFGAGELAGWLGELLVWRWRGRARVRVATVLLGLVFALAPGGLVLAQEHDRLEQMRKPRAWSNSKEDWKIQRAFSAAARDARLVVASRPLFAFRAGKPVPPALAVTSWKRFRSGLLGSSQVIRQIREHRPEVVLLSSRWPSSVRGAVRRELKKKYRVSQRFQHQISEIWVLRSAAPDEPVRASGVAPRAPAGAVPSRFTPPAREPARPDAAPAPADPDAP